MTVTIEGTPTWRTPPVEVNKPTPATSGAPDAFRSLRAEMDRLFDRFAGGWGFPSLGRMLDPAPTLHYENSFSVPSPAVDITEDDTGYKLAAELPGPGEKEIEVMVSGDTLTLKARKGRRSNRQTRTSISPSARMAPSRAPVEDYGGCS